MVAAWMDTSGLLSPTKLIFFTYKWAEIGRKADSDIASVVSSILGIDINVLNNTTPINSCSIAQRMSWAVNRVTSRVEDTAYSLMGIFSVNMPLLYGEGEKAFLRLQEEIMKVSDDETLFAWADESRRPQSANSYAQCVSGLLAQGPSAFRDAQQLVQIYVKKPRPPFTMTSKGLSLSLPLENADGDMFFAPLRCLNLYGHTRIGIYLQKAPLSAAQYARAHCWKLAAANGQSQADLKMLYVKQNPDQPQTYMCLGG